ncbi:MAG: HlyC/CorC family transporter [Streptosporangiales bacterium]|nr:HlyC/CorC family transporter [Streptosporangiales bacterium]
MSGGHTWLVVFAVALVVAAGLLAASETALSRVSRVDVEEAVRAGRRGAACLQRLVAEPSRYLNLALLLRKGCEVTAAVLVTVVLLQTLGRPVLAVVIAAASTVVVTYIAVGVAPRTLGRQHAGTVARVAAVPMYWLGRVLGPLARLLIMIGNALTPGRGFRDGPFASEAELRDLVDLAEERRLIEEDERQMIHSVFELGDTLVREVMVPRTEIVSIERRKTLRQAQSLALRSGFSRIPVVGANEDDIVGIVYLKDVVRRVFDDPDATTERVESVMREAYFVPESKPADDLLREMQAKQVHVAIIVDEYGGTAGLVTIEDILEEIVGEITDEYDVETPPIEALGDGRLRVTARLPVEDLEEELDVEIDEEGVTTVGGLLAQALGRVPIPGASARLAGLRLTAESAVGRRNRIGTVLVERLAGAPGYGSPAGETASAEPTAGERADARR